MLFRLFSGQDFQWALISLLLTLPCVLIALTFHEAAHAFVAYKCGDPTARALGRLTLNPIKHLDPLGTLAMFLFGYGWAKPVPINSRYFKNPKKGMALTALAGPCMNLILGFIGAVIHAILYRVSLRVGSPLVLEVAILFFWVFTELNVVYAVFNMLPVPPFDGSRAFLIFLPTKAYFGIMKYEKIIMIVVLVGFATGLLWSPVEWIAGALMNGINALVGLIF